MSFCSPFFKLVGEEGESMFIHLGYISSVCEHKTDIHWYLKITHYKHRVSISCFYNSHLSILSVKDSLLSAMKRYEQSQKDFIIDRFVSSFIDITPPETRVINVKDIIESTYTERDYGHFVDILFRKGNPVNFEFDNESDAQQAMEKIMDHAEKYQRFLYSIR
jgi:hypothetical protein